MHLGITGYPSSLLRHYPALCSLLRIAVWIWTILAIWIPSFSPTRHSMAWSHGTLKTDQSAKNKSLLESFTSPENQNHSRSKWEQKAILPKTFSELFWNSTSTATSDKADTWNADLFLESHQQQVLSEKPQAWNGSILIQKSAPYAQSSSHHMN